MGIRFDMASANWIAHLLHPSAQLPSLGDSFTEWDTLRAFLRKIQYGFYSSPYGAARFRDMVMYAEAMLDSTEHEQSGFGLKAALHEIRRFLSDRPWTALVVPSGRDSELDSKLSSEEFLRFLVGVAPDDPGLILQLEDYPRVFALIDVFPAFRTALADSANWPGVLLWTGEGDSVFLPFGTNQIEELKRRAYWIFSHLSSSLGIDLEILKRQYSREFPQSTVSAKNILHLVQLSDLHIGSAEASRRIPRVQQILRNLVGELDQSGRIVCVVTGDFVDSPTNANFDAARGFMDFLRYLTSSEPVVVLGNHDVRKEGILAETFKQALRFPTHPRVDWHEDAHVGLVCMNSVTGGRLARGYIGETQLMDLGNEIDRRKDWRDYSLLGLLHHHPIPVDVPDWYARPFYERILGSSFEKTDALEDAEDLLRFAAHRNLGAILHGHKHIPRATESDDGLPVFGCGSSVGKVSTTNGGTYMSVNVVTIDGAAQRVIGRVLAERIPGGGLMEEKRHEVVLIAGGA